MLYVPTLLTLIALAYYGLARLSDRLFAEQPDTLPG